jgi:hypothetical protein
MRNCWVGDIADFAKYALLKRLAGSDLRIGVLWYLTTHYAPSKPLTAYLRQPERYAPLDPDLFEALRRLRPGERDLTVEDVERGDVLPSETVFYASPLTTSPPPLKQRREQRERWFEQGLEQTKCCNLIFLDPDTGVLPPRYKVHRTHGDKYAAVEEVLAIVSRGQSVACVQFGKRGHLEGGIPKLARERLAMLRDALAARDFPEPFGIWWPDRHKVGLLIAPCASDARKLRKRRDDILADPTWSRIEVSALECPARAPSDLNTAS